LVASTGTTFLYIRKNSMVRCPSRAAIAAAQRSTGQPPSKKGRGRPTKFAARPPSAQDVRRGELLKASFARDANTADRVLRTFEGFLRMNEAQPVAEAVWIFLGQQLENGCAASTLATYMELIAVQLPYARQLTSADRLALYDAQKAIQAMAADSNDIQQKKDASGGDLDAIVQSLQGPWRMIAIMARTVGGRMRDLTRLRRRQISITATGVNVQWRFTKTLRTRNLRRRLHYDFSWSNSAAFAQELAAYLAKFGADDLPFGSLVKNSRHIATGFNQQMKRANLPFTSYVFRRALAISLRKMGTSEEKITLLLGDTNKNTPAASYDEHA
jgi:hypothetical protein